jgi:hypothetical protein
MEMLWTFENNSFDFIHARDLLLSVRDWPKLVKQCYEYAALPSNSRKPGRLLMLVPISHLKPGAYLELQCIYPLLHCDDNSTPPTSNLFLFSQHAREASARMNTLLDAIASYASYMQAAGFENVTETRYKLPSGPWPKDKRMKLIGAFEMHNLLRGLSAMSLRMFNKGYGWTREEIEVFLVGVRRDVQNMHYHTYWDL